MPRVLGAPPGMACNAAANPSQRSSSSRHVSVPSSSTSPGRSGQRCAADAKPDVTAMFSRVASPRLSEGSGPVASVQSTGRAAEWQGDQKCGSHGHVLSRRQPRTGNRRSRANRSSACCITSRTCSQFADVRSLPNSAAMFIGSSTWVTIFVGSGTLGRGDARTG